MLYVFENYVLDTDRRELRCGPRLVSLEPQVFDILSFLVRNRQRVVSKDDLIGAVWGGRIVSESTFTTRITAVRSAIGDDGEAQRLIRTLPRRGLRFVGRVSENEHEPTPTGSSEGNGTLRSERTGVASEGLTSAAMLLPDKPSIAILPFVNLSADPEQDYFADGIVEEVTAALSRFPSLFVIARSSSFTYKGRALDVRQIGYELGVRYLLEGSVRKAGNRLRVGGQLTQADCGLHVWAERYEGKLDDIFALQDEMTASIVGALVPSIQKAEIERARRKPPENLDTYELYLQGLAALFSGTREGNDDALQLLGRALVRDPHFVPAVVTLENCWTMRYVQGWSPLSEAHAQSTRYARLAVQIDPDNAEALAVLARRTPYMTRDYQEAVALAERAVSIDPNSASAWRHSGFALMLCGEAEKALSYLERANRLSPRDPRADDVWLGMGLALVQLGRDSEAITITRRAIQKNPTIAGPWRTLTAALAMSGLLDEARSALERALEIDPECSVKTMALRIGYSEKAGARIFEGWRRAGMPE